MPLPMFDEEVRVLSKMQDVHGVMRLYAMGFIDSDQPITLPEDTAEEPASKITGKVKMFIPSEALSFLEELAERTAQNQENIQNEKWISNWIPFMAIQTVPKQENLLKLCNPHFRQGKLFPVAAGVEVIKQICSILQTAHDRKIVYRDHKILHYYFGDERVTMIDWNGAKDLSDLPGGDIQHHIEDDLVQFAARSLHYILTGRDAPGAVRMNNRVDEIDQAPKQYDPLWDIDDERLPIKLKEVITSALHGEYKSAAELSSAINKYKL